MPLLYFISFYITLPWLYFIQIWFNTVKVNSGRGYHLHMSSRHRMTYSFFVPLAAEADLSHTFHSTTTSIWYLEIANNTRCDVLGGVKVSASIVLASHGRVM